MMEHNQMSDGHRHAPRRFANAALAKLIAEPCYNWPSCNCGKRWDTWPQTLDEWGDQGDLPSPPPDAEALGDALMAVVCMLACASEHAPDKRVRMAAKLQLAQPLFAAVVAGCEPHDVIAERLAAARAEAEREAAQGADGADAPSESGNSEAEPWAII